MALSRDDVMRMRRLSSRANPRIKEWASLSDRRRREELGATLAEGARLCREALACPPGGAFEPTALIVSDAGALRPEAEELFRAAGERGLERFSLADDCYAKLSGLGETDGLAVALAFRRDDREPAILFAEPGAKWLVAAGVGEPGNAGALARTALAAGASGCAFVGGVDVFSPKFLRGSMGASFRIPCLRLEEEAFLAAAGTPGVNLLIADSSSEREAVDYRLAEYHTPMVLTIGGERGLPDALAGIAATRIRIPLAGGVESLNLAVAAGVILFEAARGRFDA